MILPDHEIKKLLKEGRLVIEPLEDPEVQIQSAGVDLRLGNEFRIFKVTSTPFIDTRQESKDYTEKIVLDDNKPFIIHPGEFVLASIKEYIKMIEYNYLPDVDINRKCRKCQYKDICNMINS